MENEVNNLFNFIPVSYRTSLSLINLKFIKEALSITINNNILFITITSIPFFRFITRFINIRNLVLTLII